MPCARGPVRCRPPPCLSIDGSMLASVRREIELLKKSRPGRRFQDRHDRAKRKRSSLAGKVARVGAGLAIVAAGVLLMPAPGPGWLIFILGLSLVGSDVAVVARGMDWAEVQVRAAGAWARRFWTSASAPVRVVMSLGIAAAVTGGGYGLYRIFIAR